MADTRRGQSRPKSAWDEQGDCDEVLNKIEGLQQKFPVFDELVRNFNEQYIAAKEEVINLKLEYENKTKYSKSQAVAKQEYEKKLTEANEEIELLKYKQARLEEDINKKDLQEKKLAAEIGTLRTRLSQVMGSKLTDNNPAIADLSDKYRPSKLGEKYSELYDNEWTDAYEEINKTCDEKETIKKLLDILMYVNRKCQEYWKEYTTKLERALTVDSRIKLPEYVMTQYKNFSKNVAPELIEYFYEQITNGAYGYTFIRNRRCESYVKGCVACCWLMAAQDPPVTIDTEDRFSKIDFDTNLFRAYTQTGDKLDYVVWPPLYLHHEGPLLCKGVAQAVKRERTKGAQVVSTGSNGRSTASKINFASTLPLSDKRNKNMNTQYQTGSRRSPVNMDITDVERESQNSETGGQAAHTDTYQQQTLGNNQEMADKPSQASQSGSQQEGYDQTLVRESQYQGQIDRSNGSRSTFAKSMFVSSNNRNAGIDVLRQSQLGIGSAKMDTAEVEKTTSAGTSEQMSYGHQTIYPQQTTTQEQHSQLNNFQSTFNQNQQNQNFQTSTHIPTAGGQITWNHFRKPTHQEMETFIRYVSQGVPEHTIRACMGDYTYVLCRDYNNYFSQVY